MIRLGWDRWMKRLLLLHRLLHIVKDFDVYMRCMLRSLDVNGKLSHSHNMAIAVPPPIDSLFENLPLNSEKPTL
jgi:hypothetical protein